MTNESPPVISMKVYLVWAGQYEDSSVVGVFTDLELANEFAKQYQEYATVSEYALNPPLRSPKGSKWHKVVMDKEGLYAMGDFRENDAWRSYYDCPSMYGGLYSGKMEFYVCALNWQEAIRIANGRRLEIIARGEWIEKEIEIV